MAAPSDLTTREAVTCLVAAILTSAGHDGAAQAEALVADVLGEGLERRDIGREEIETNPPLVAGLKVKP